MKKIVEKIKKAGVLFIAISIIAIIISGCSKYRTDNIDEYGEYEGTFYSEPALLPNSIENVDVLDYKYIYEADILDDNQYIFESTI